MGDLTNEIAVRNLKNPAAGNNVSFISRSSMAAFSKREYPYDDFSDLSEVQHPSKCAKIDGILSSLSPMKTSTTGTTKYFDGEITNGKKRLRLVGFDSKVQQKLQQFYENEDSITLHNCEIKESKYSSGFEVVVRKSSDFQKSPSKYELPSRTAADSIVISDLKKLENFQPVSVRVKVTTVGHKQTVKNNLVKQECGIADCTGTCHITLWESYVDLLQEGASYQMSGLIVRTFNGKKYLSVPRENFNFEAIDDIGDVEKEELEDRVMKGVVVIGIKFYDTYNACYSCKGKVTPLSATLGDCTKCGIAQKLDRCKPSISAKLDVEADGVIKCLTSFSPIIEEICNKNDPTKEDLLCCKPFNLMYSEKNIITSITRF